MDRSSREREDVLLTSHAPGMGGDSPNCRHRHTSQGCWGGGGGGCRPPPPQDLGTDTFFGQSSQCSRAIQLADRAAKSSP